MAQGQEANGDKLGNCFRSSIQLGDSNEYKQHTIS